LKYREEFPYPVRTIENAWIPMPDGVRLAARIWMPADAEQNPSPALLEYIPYRKRDDERLKAESIHAYFAGHGYVSLRVDLRGSGDSEGVLEDEYLQQEQDDGLAVLKWLARQPWCSGRVGMFGISWGGFNALQIAARKPPELGAIITVCSTDDRYRDDIHHMGGCLLGDNLSWASTMFDYNALPPDPEIVGERWREMWFERLRGSGLWLAKWLGHQRRDAYWRHGSICEDYAGIEVPVYAVSGWADGYSNAVFRLMKHLKVTRKGLIGPWSHKYPHLGEPGPAIGFLQESLRWWDRWLKDAPNGIDEEPMLRVWIQDSVPPTTQYSHRPGRWVAEECWPPADLRLLEFGMNDRGRLAAGDGEPDDSECVLRSPLSVGLYAGKWCSYAAGPDLAYDQREEDGGALVFETGPLEKVIEILGRVLVELELRVDRPVAMIAARLSDVAPDGRATRVTYGLLNLTHRDGSESPEPLEPGKRYRVQVWMNEIGQAFPAGHRIRLSLSTSYWPLAWPPPEPVEMRVYPTRSRLRLPVREPRPGDSALVPFALPEAARPGPCEMIEPAHHTWLVKRDLATDVSTLEVINDHGGCRLGDIDLVMKTCASEYYSSCGADFASPRGEAVWKRTLRRGDWEIHTETRTVLTCTREHFRVTAELDVREGDTRVFSDDWDIWIPRDLV